MITRLIAFLQLCRPANLPTAAADVIAGLAIAGFFKSNTLIQPHIGWFLVLSSVFLYAGGVVLNDVFDFELDSVERPERPIPKGIVKLGEARIFGFSLLLIGIVLATGVSLTTGFLALILSLLILSYDSYSKKHTFLGPLNMGLCRGVNLLLGIMVFGNFMHMKFALIPILYIGAITMISQGEVHGNNKKNILTAGLLYTLVVVLLLYFQRPYLKSLGWNLVFLVLFIFAIGRPLLKAYKHNLPDNIRESVKAGVISIILLDAVMAVPFSNLMVGIMILALLPLSIVLSKVFAVT